MNRLQKGFKLPDHKYRSLSNPKIAAVGSPRLVTLSLHQHGPAPLVPCVAAGETVLVGTVIANPRDEKGVPLHASVSGHVQIITRDFIRIESDESDRLEPSIRPSEHIPAEAAEIIKLIREAGIVHMDERSSPIHTELQNQLEKGADILVINGCESEPFLVSNYLLMLTHGTEILKGTELLRIACGAKRALIATEDDKSEAAEIMNSKNYGLKLNLIETLLLPTRYPQGHPQVLTELFPRQKVWVADIATVFAVYEAVYLKKPLYERAVTVSGPCIIEPKNMWARIGTSAADLIRSAKGLMREPKSVIFGGPMSGEAIASLDTPVVKKTSGILALPNGLAENGREEVCIRCGLCADHCPESLMPETIVKAVRSADLELAMDYELNACIECGLCSYLCPSGIPLAEIIRETKRKIETARPSRETADVFSFKS